MQASPAGVAAEVATKSGVPGVVSEVVVVAAAAAAPTPAATATATPTPAASSSEAVENEKEKASGQETAEANSANTTNTATSADEHHAILMANERELQQMKLCIFGFGKYSNKKDVRKFLDRNKVEHVNVKKARGQELAFIGFENIEKRAAASEKLSTLKYKGTKLDVSDARARKIRRPEKRTLHYGSDATAGGDPKRRNDSGKSVTASAPARPRTIQDQVTPLASTPYSEQLENKQAAGTTNIVRMIRRIRKKYVQFSKRMNGGRGRGRGGRGRGGGRSGGARRGGDKPMEETSPYDLEWVFHGEKRFPIEPIIHLPESESIGYRNKCSYTIGRNSDGRTEIGFRLGGFNSTSGVTVVDPAGCKNVSEVDFACLKVVRQYLISGADSGGSSLQPFDAITKQGFWQGMLVRHSKRTREFMLAFTVCTEGLEASQVQEAEDHLKEYLLENISTVVAENIEFKLASLQMRHHSDAQRASGDYGTYRTIHGRGYIEEKMLGLTFQVSAEAFFQVNTRCAELLFERVGEWVQQGTPSSKADVVDGKPSSNSVADTLLLDVCCGTGVIGLTLAKKAKKVVGLELIPQAVEDAKRNATANEVSNAVFFAGRAEKTLRDVLKDTSEFGSIVGVVDPPRSGLHPDVIKALRKCKKMQHLIYVSCNPSGTLLENAAALCAPIDETSHKQVKTHGFPFRPVRAVPVDLFPHTDHCEMVVVFSRLSKKSSSETEQADKLDTEEKQEEQGKAEQ